MKHLLTILITLFSVNLAFAEKFSMRDCMLLPIVDDSGNSFSYKVYEEIEVYLKNSGWCHYASSADVIGVFSRYRDNLTTHLKDPGVIATVADRLRVGTLIRIGLNFDADKTTINFDVIGENGYDVYMTEKTVINSIDLNQIRTTIVNWLDIYEASMPYDGKVLGVLGDQVTIGLPKFISVRAGTKFTISRFLKKTKHPLLGKIVDWERVNLAEGQVVNLSSSQALGQIKVYTSNKRVLRGDWVRLEKDNSSRKVLAKRKYPYSQDSFGKLGELSLTFNMSSHTTTTNTGDSKKAGGYLFGIAADAELWMTRSYFVMGEFSKRIGTLEAVTGNPDVNQPGQDITALKIAGGFKYLPMGFFYGPQVNAFIGYQSYSYVMDKSATDGYGSNSFTGLYVGMSGSIPLQRGLRIFGQGEISPFLEFSDDDTIFGTQRSISSLSFEAGAHYSYTRNLKLTASFESISNTAKFSGTNTEVSYRDNMLKVGAVLGL